MQYELIGLLLGFLQGMFEWLPVSSEGQLVIVIANLMQLNIEVATSLALFSHIGTAMVIIIYYRYEFSLIITSSISYLRNKMFNENITQDTYHQGVLLAKLLVIVSIFTLPTALISLLVFEGLVANLNQSFNISISDAITLLIGVLLIVTGLMLRLRKNSEVNLTDNSKFEDLPFVEAMFLGLLQGLAALPGLSRSGTTITYLLVGTKLNQNEALRGSFLVAVPVSLGAGLLQVVRGKVMLTTQGIMSGDGTQLLMNYSGVIILILSSFFFGYITLKVFLDVSKRVDFDKFMIIFGLIAVVAVMLSIIL